MNDLALDPTETRQPRAVHSVPRAKGRPTGRIAVFSALGIAGLAAFAGATQVMSGLVAPSAPKARITAVPQSAADWPDLKDGLPDLAPASASAPRQIALPAAERPSTFVASPQPLAAAEPAAPPMRIAAKPAQPIVEAAPPAPKLAQPAPKPALAEPKPAPVIENAAVIGPARQAATIPPSRTVATLAARPVETVRAKTASTTFAALPPAGEAASAKPEAVKTTPEKPAPAAEAKEPAGTAAKPAQRTAKPKEAVKEAVKDAGKRAAKETKPASGKAAPVSVAAASPADDDETEVLGIRMPTLAATGRKIGAGVEALGDAVKSLPDKF